MNFELKVHSDYRGKFAEVFKCKDGQVSYITINPKCTRGLHFHTIQTEQFMVIKGEAVMRTREIGELNIEETVLSDKKPEVFVVKPYVTHNITNKKDEECIVLLVTDKPFNNYDTDTYSSSLNPYVYVRQAVKNGESLLSLCCGIGLELRDLNASSIIGVDICKPYLDNLNVPGVTKVLSDAKSYIMNAPSKSVDVISFIDGLEHIDKEDGKVILEHCKRVARKKVLVFTQDGYLRNEPHNAWGIEGGDVYQRHISGWSIKEVEDFGYTLIACNDDISQHNELYTAVMFEWKAE